MSKIRRWCLSAFSSSPLPLNSGHPISSSRNFSIVLNWEEMRTNSDFINEFLKTEVKPLRWKEGTHILSQSKLSGGGEKHQITEGEGELLSRPVPSSQLLPDHQEHELVTASEPLQKVLFLKFKVNNPSQRSLEFNLCSTQKTLGFKHCEGCSCPAVTP